MLKNHANDRQNSVNDLKSKKSLTYLTISRSGIFIHHGSFFAAGSTLFIVLHIHNHSASQG